ncbi:MAG: amidohydrolase family protein [Alphaproteobacteria bacterium]
MTDRARTWRPERSPIDFALPAGATDCHCHVFGPAARFPFAPKSGFKPGDAPKEELFALHDQMGIERCVIVQSGCHGFDNGAVADAIAARPGRYKGVALAPADIADAQIAALARQGFLGVRFNYMAHLAPGAGPEELRALAPRLSKAGWHLQVHMEARLIPDLAPVLAALPVTVVIDHIGRVDASLGLDQPLFRALMTLMENHHVWMKVSGTDRASRQGPPYADAVPLARRLVETFPDRVVWGTDWPHPNYHAPPPDDGAIVAVLPQIAPTSALLEALLVDNPARLYGFERGKGR